MVEFDLRDLSFGGGAVGGDAVLFTLQVRDAYGVLVVSLEKLVALTLQTIERFPRLLTNVDRIRHDRGHVVLDQPADLRECVVPEGDRGPVTLNEIFGMGYGHGPEGAAVLIALSPQTVEVFVVIACSVARLIESYCIEYQNTSVPEDYKINVALTAIKELTMVEYAELTRRLREWFSTINRSDIP